MGEGSSVWIFVRLRSLPGYGRFNALRGCRHARETGTPVIRSDSSHRQRCASALYDLAEDSIRVGGDHRDLRAPDGAFHEEETQGFGVFGIVRWSGTVSAGRRIATAIVSLCTLRPRA